jgi:hypothetical protein
MQIYFSTLICMKEIFELVVIVFFIIITVCLVLCVCVWRTSPFKGTNWNVTFMIKFNRSTLDNEYADQEIVNVCLHYTMTSNRSQVRMSRSETFFLYIWYTTPVSWITTYCFTCYLFLWQIYLLRTIKINVFLLLPDERRSSNKLFIRYKYKISLLFR